MLKYSLLLLCLFFSTTQNFIGKRYGAAAGNQFLFSAMQALAAAATFLVINIISGNGFSIPWKVFLYSAAFAVTWGVTTFSLLMALKHGTLSRNTLASCFSSVLVVLFGIVFLKETVSVYLLVGIVLYCVSMFLANYRKSDAKISLLWVIFAVIHVVGAASCSIVQKLETVNCGGGQYGNMFMFWALLICGISFMSYSFISQGKALCFQTIRKFKFSAVVNGALNGAVNYLVIRLNLLMPASILFPVISVGSFILTLAASFCIFKERFSKMQVIGFVIGIFAVLMFNL